MLNLIRRHEECYGFLLWKWNYFQVELWICPPLSVVKKHTHDEQDIELTYLFGNAHFFRKKTTQVEHFWAKPSKWFRTFSIPRGVVHWFTTDSKWPLIFITTERWYSKPTSASVDFNLIK